MATWIPIEDEVAALGVATMLGRWRSGTPEWHEARKGIGGSEVGAICGVNPYKSPAMVLAAKLGHEEPMVPNLAMKLGTHFEAPIRRLWKEENAAFLECYDTGTWQHIAQPTWKANPDGLIRWNDGTLGVLEIKYTARKWTSVPDYYRYQVLWYMNVLGLRRAILVQCVGHTIAEWTIDYDENKLQEITTKVLAFEDDLLRRQNGI